MGGSQTWSRDDDGLNKNPLDGCVNCNISRKYALGVSLGRIDVIIIKERIASLCFTLNTITSNKC